ncbi:cytochrome c biogenesis heme-transporting ATPase CcmA [Pseudohaliea rubra]|uniref:ABC transporter involved in cytochrome c biogenesis, ATPase component CcmA n=1 Tax=Pseudohaliea rubra DSM 19751 TaxID=1265313 RepID=A0A095VQL1_9GAMM|nr:cytochrome c biogenesis heme-transporting ATPase CcmA [Pseudohaliea rubra]KGE03408.1 ABC transporter involved in cytochrome c biogenesis, ATPase component CcmA [Pseudohaliea rubra DSM 19751]
MSTAAKPLLSASELALERGGRQLFSGLTLAVAPGQLVQVEGANGAGKTSLLRILAGLSRYGFEGRVTRSAPLLFLGHHPAVKGLLTARENLRWHPAGEGSHDDVAIDAALASVGLYGYEDVPAHSLSAGQHRRVNLARLYLSPSPLWLLDEPFTAIDRDGVAALQALFVAHAERGGAVLFTSHQPLAVSYRVDSVLLRPEHIA